MRILFINPAGFGTNEYPPLGLLYLASVAKRNEHEVDFFDEGIDKSESNVIEYVKKQKPEIVAFSLYTVNLIDSYRIIKKISKLNPRPTIITGGPHATALPEKTLQECPEIDYLIYGEGENTFIELLEALEEEKEVKNIKGIYYHNNGIIMHTEPRPYIKDLDSLPFPSYDVIQKYHYPMDMVVKGKKVATVITSRGCPYHCAFCNKAVFGDEYRRRSPKNVVSEIKELINKGIDEIYFVDDLFAFNKKWLSDFYKELDKEKIRIPWKCLGRVGALDHNDFKAMKEHGCYVIELGIESGNNEILKDIHKKITIEEAERTVKEAKKAGLAVHTFWILGHRLDTEETIKQTIDTAKRFNSDFVSFFVLVPFPGTEVYRFIPEELRCRWERIGYYHKDTLPISICKVSPQRLLELEEEAFWHYFLRFRYIIDNIIFTKSRLRLIKIKMILWRLKIHLKKVLK